MLGHDTVVLCYHAVSDDWPIDLTIRPATLEQQVRWLLDRGYAPATFHQAVFAPPSRKTFAVTFDDAWRSIYTLGLPVLSALGVPATVFAVTEPTGPPTRLLRGPILEQYLGGPHEHELMPMSWDELGEVADAGWEVGSHTVTHPYLTDVDDAQLRVELGESKARVEEMLGRPCPTIAYPSGSFDRRVMRFTEEAGYDLAAALPASFSWAPELLAYPRVSVQRDDSMWTFQLKLSRSVRTLRRTPIWPALDNARRRALRRPPTRAGSSPS